MLLIFVCVACKAQKIRFTDTTNVWYLCNDDPFSSPYFRKTGVVKFYKDSIINGKKYISFGIRNDWCDWLREDTANGLVYCRKDTDTTEVILYNYNLGIGDTLVSYMFNDTTYFTVWRIDSVLINGVIHKVQHFNPAGYIIEGIGSCLGPQMLEPPHPDMWHYICCFENNGNRPPVTTFNSNTTGLDNTTSCMLSVPEIAPAKMPQVIPNPVNASAKIVLPRPVLHGLLTVYNACGQIIAEKNIVNSPDVPIGKYISVPGFCFYKITTDEGDCYSGRFIVQ